MVTGPDRIDIGDDAVAMRARHREALCALAAFVEVREASDAQEAIDLIQSVRPVLAILDLSMPAEGAGGLGVVGRLQGALYPNRVYEPFTPSLSTQVPTGRCKVPIR